MPTLRSDKSTPVYTGTILTFERGRTLRVAEYLRNGGTVTQAFSDSDWKLDHREVLLLSLNPDFPSIGGAVLFERMRGNGGTGTIKMRVINHVLFEPIVPADLTDILRLDKWISLLGEQRLLEPTIWERLLTRLMELRPEASEAIARILAQRSAEPLPKDASQRAERLWEQRDGIGLAVDIGGGDRADVLKGVALNEHEQAASAVDFFANLRFYEQHYINHDSKVFQDLLTDNYRSITFPGSNNSSGLPPLEWT